MTGMSKARVRLCVKPRCISDRAVYGLPPLCLVRDRLEALEACSTTSGALGLPGIFSSSPGQPCNRPDTRHQEQASQPEDTGKEYCCLPKGKQVEEWFDEDQHSAPKL